MLPTGTALPLRSLFHGPNSFAYWVRLESDWLTSLRNFLIDDLNINSGCLTSAALWERFSSGSRDRCL